MVHEDDEDAVAKPLMVVGRYAIYGEIAAGGMATVHLGRLLGPVGFSRTVAIKRLHAHLAKDPEFTAMFLDEARLAARIRHPNVVSTLDVVASRGELFLVMDYVHAESLNQLLHHMSRRKERIPLGIVGNLISGMLQGLHAAHEARSDHGEALGIVHRDVSPQNLLIGTDGVPRLLDFGVAKAMGRVATTHGGQLKGKIGYMSPEQVLGAEVTRRTDVWGAGAVLWQMLAGHNVFKRNTEAETLHKIITAEVPPPSQFVEGLSPEIDAVVLRALSKSAKDRFETAHEMAVACEQVLPLVSQREVAEWMEKVAGESLSRLAERVAEVESLSLAVRPEPSIPPLPRESMASISGGSFDPMASTVPPPPVDAHSRKRPLLWPVVGVIAVVLGVGAGFVARSWLTPDTVAASTPAASAVQTAPPPVSTNAAAQEPPPPVASSPASATASAPAQPSATAEKPPAAATTPPKPTRRPPRPRPPSTKKPRNESLYVRE